MVIQMVAPQLEAIRLAATTMATLTLALEGLFAGTVGPTVVVPIGVEIVIAKPKVIKIVQRSVTAWAEVTGTVYPLHLQHET